MASPPQSDMADDYQFPLPGFRFHPTDEELVVFYLRRKVHNKPLAIELIKQIDIYKYSPWDLPHSSNATGEKEWYFFCKRGRKYKNSVRPNRVTGSGFWKATGIDKPIYGHGGQSQQCVGLKKTLVYYRGSAGRGTKTEWMMNEFRLPSSTSSSDPLCRIVRNNLDEAEIWTLCRIFKRNVSTRKAINAPNWREVPAAKSRAMENMNFRATTNIDIDRYSDDNEESSYINFASNNNNSFIGFDHVNEAQNSDQIQMLHGGRFMTNYCGTTDQPPSAGGHNSSANVSPSSSSFSDFDEDATDLFGYEKWEELKSILESDLES